MVPPTPVNGALVPATASQRSSPHPTSEVGQAITVQQAAVPGLLRTNDTIAVLTPQATIPGVHTATIQKMLFSDLYKSTKSPLSRLLQHTQQPLPGRQECDPDLLSRDKGKQKEAIRRHLAERIRNDWVFNWSPAAKVASVGVSASEDPIQQVQPVSPQQAATDELQEPSGPSLNDADDGYRCDDDDENDDGDEGDAASIYSIVSEDLTRFRPRAEWLSDLSDDDNDEAVSPLAYRFETPDAVGPAVLATEIARSAKRRREARAEMEWNSGLACFSARRDAWTGAKVVHVRPRHVESVPTSPATKRLSFWRMSSPPSPVSPADSPAGSTVGTASLSLSGTRNSGDTTTQSSVHTEPNEPKLREDYSEYPVQTLLPIGPPLLPVDNPMRASITPATYLAIYDKIIVHVLTPSCPINLADMLRACVVGWKRDGEWPPRAAPVVPVVASPRKKRKDSNTDRKSSIGRRLSFNLLGRRPSDGSDPNAAATGPNAKQDEAGGPRGMKRSLQRVLRIAQDI